MENGDKIKQNKDLFFPKSVFIIYLSHEYR